MSKIASLADDLALALAAPRIRIQAPVPGHSYVGIEVPNDEMALVALRDILESETFQRNKTSLRFALGEDVAGHPITANLEGHAAFVDRRHDRFRQVGVRELDPDLLPAQQYTG